ncbi:hypothetical protein [Actinomyces faecalis]|uniref:hypothetical protein n=1 Tax=Actinomyces faecalis TaxID=2722820 RepID=UPI0015556AA4|nr:hypothetical protein [Actinomyces faecalis]
MPDAVPSSPPGRHSGTLVGNGKQALSLVACALRGTGTRTVLAPRYSCQTMLAPFALEGMHLRLVDVADDLLLDPTDLSNALHEEPGAAVLHCETYGASARPALLHALEQAHQADSTVILDATHSLLERPELLTSSPVLPPGPWQVALASTRKLLPVPDGASLAWCDGHLAARLDQLARTATSRGSDSAIESLGRQALSAQARLTRTLASRTAPGTGASARLSPQAQKERLEVCRLTETHEDAVERAMEPRAASALTHRVLASTGVALERRRHSAGLRQELAQALRTSRSRLRLLPALSAGCLALEGEEDAVVRLRTALSEAALWGPVTWERPEGDSDPRPWPAVVTLPTDQPERAGELLALVRACR